MTDKPHRVSCSLLRRNVERATACWPWLEKHHEHRLRGVHRGRASGAVDVLLEIMLEQVERRVKK